MQTTINLRIDSFLKEQLEVVAKDRCKNLSDLLREIIAFHLLDYFEDGYPEVSGNTIIIDLSDYDFDSEL